MLKKLTTNSINNEKKEVAERTASICSPSTCLAQCGSLRDVYGDTRLAIYYGA